MAIDDADRSGGGLSGDESTGDHGATVGAYTWAHFMDEHGYGNEVDPLYRAAGDVEGVGGVVPSGDDWDAVDFDPATYLGFDPDLTEAAIGSVATPGARAVLEAVRDDLSAREARVRHREYTREHYRSDVGGDPEDRLGADGETLISEAKGDAERLAAVVDRRTVDVRDEVDEDGFFSTPEGYTTVTNRYDMEKAVPMDKKVHFREVNRYWVNKPYAFVTIFHSEKENEKKYYLIEPYLNGIEIDLRDFLSKKLRTAIKYSEEETDVKGDEDARKGVIERETRKLLRRYDLFSGSVGGGAGGDEGLLDRVRSVMDDEEADIGTDRQGDLDGISVRPEPTLLAEDPDDLSEYQVEKVLYLLKRDFIGYERIDGVKHDINVEDISCDGYNSPVFVYHTDYEQIISNVYHGEDELDDFVVKLAQRSGKGISKRRPQVDATLPDGSRAQLTLGTEVSDHGTNYTIRQFKDVPFTPIDLVNWSTFSLDEMAFLWLCIENNKSLIFAGGTASGKTTSLNAVSLFIPSNTKIVSIEDTREVELPQRNWIASVTRPSFSDDEQGDVDEFDLLEAALRQRPDYIVMGEIRGEEGRTLFQVMSTGHTTYTTFHADSVGEVLKRFTTDPINVSKTMFTALDLVSIQTQTRVQGHKVRRNKNLTEINHYDAENDEINVQDVYQWQAETDEFLEMGDSSTLEEIKFDRGWSDRKLERELFKRRVVIAYLIENGLSEYVEVAATIQAFINDPDTMLTIIANGQLEESLEDLRDMESVLIDVDPEKEALVPRPDPGEETASLAREILEEAEDELFDGYRGRQRDGISSVLAADAAAAGAAGAPAGEAAELGAPGDAGGSGEPASAADGGTTGATPAGGADEADEPAAPTGRPTGADSVDTAADTDPDGETGDVFGRDDGETATDDGGSGVFDGETDVEPGSGSVADTGNDVAPHGGETDEDGPGPDDGNDGLFVTGATDDGTDASVDGDVGEPFDGDAGSDPEDGGDDAGTVDDSTEGDGDSPTDGDDPVFGAEDEGGDSVFSDSDESIFGGGDEE